MSRSSRHFLLSPFQNEKLEYYFRFLAPDEDGNLEKNSIARLMDRILDFTGWDEQSPMAHECREVHEAFFELLFEKARETEGSAVGKVTLENWLSMWSGILPGVMSMHNLPVWLRLMPQLLFKIVDRRRQNYLTANDLEIFYKEMVHLDPDQAHETALEAYDHMTDNGRYPLDLNSYEQLFANFLIGRTPYGPGRYIFGCFEHDVQPFQLIAPAPEPDDNVIEVKKVTAGRRPSRQLSLGHS
ncbi:sarcoplasmic calcium-binding proteins II, V, VI, and VII-like [Physella acuta]|uniref:sarcoplasmic calcium-binding proteins II, V, VI, and VII-like n=1 Tax=Physella acuta TaxID=109671 RepID=UPI0027DDDC78|nr:sarcoplasmic calcium-binding proteins II, V, VI, and VII-like [Physella acuta]XP_059177438.1 sarcoplasmic calcium-binding proteins II, V, VI, and VII-like [Physella acuta]XP_059177439.1 sarcoplasmic calcium-binding proteins II, V, VI, and VII-like [Physella acuta]XP_059177440.1 sarcoplasmic calcium-binding proteins II, V, VI, and VII-like [Physella acuta]